MKMTAVKWLFEQLPTIDKYDPYYADIIKQAKEMEKEQIINSYDHMRCIGNFENGEQYYNETFKSE